MKARSLSSEIYSRESDTRYPIIVLFILELSREICIQNFVILSRSANLTCSMITMHRNKCKIEQDRVKLLTTESPVPILQKRELCFPMRPESCIQVEKEKFYSRFANAISAKAAKFQNSVRTGSMEVDPSMNASSVTPSVDAHVRYQLQVSALFLSRKWEKKFETPIVNINLFTRLQKAMNITKRCKLVLTLPDSEPQEVLKVVCGLAPQGGHAVQVGGGHVPHALYAHRAGIPLKRGRCQIIVKLPGLQDQKLIFEPEVTRNDRYSLQIWVQNMKFKSAWYSLLIWVQEIKVGNLGYSLLIWVPEIKRINLSVYKYGI